MGRRGRDSLIERCVEKLRVKGNEAKSMERCNDILGEYHETP